MWLELIRVRVPEADAHTKGDEFWSDILLSEIPADMAGYSVYTNAAHQNEVMLLLKWKSDRPVPGGSDLARSIAQMLKSHGLVSRSAWREKPVKS